MEILNFMLDIQNKTMEEISEFVGRNRDQLEDFRDTVNSIKDQYKDEMTLDQTAELMRQVKRLVEIS